MKLVTYFSYSGNTRKAAETIAEENHADLFEIRAKEPYTTEDVNWRDENSRVIAELKDETIRPEIERMPDLTGVDELWVGYPIWNYVHPRIINTFFDNIDMKGIKIHLFCTAGSMGIERSEEAIKRCYPDAEIVDAKRIVL